MIYFRFSFFGFRLCSVLSLFFLAGLWARSEVVYDNTAPQRDSTDRLLHWEFSNEIGDEIVLGGKGRVVTGFVFDYISLFTNNLNATAKVRFYANDGPDVDPGERVIRAPGSLLWESDPFGLLPNSGVSIRVALEVPSITVPTDLTWSVKFSNVDGKNLGLILASGPGPGSSFNDFWEKHGVWKGFRIPTPGIQNNFSARVEVQGDPAPPVPAIHLSIRTKSTGYEIRWSTTASTCILESVHNLGDANWVPTAAGLFVDGTNRFATVRSDGSSRFFRVRCP